MSRRFLPVVLAGLALSGCDFSGDFLFPGLIDGVPPVYVLTQEDGSLFEPVDITSIDDVRANTLYAEVGPPINSEFGGVTLDFIGTGSDVCVWVDPETVFWNQAVAENLQSDFARKWTYPDNFYDDGDIDLFAGLSVYYTGSPGETVGDFVVQYEDSLGNRVPVSLSECSVGIGNAHAGRGFPESCTIRATDLGISYTVLMLTYSTPLDDDRLSYGVLLANGNCENLRTAAGGVTGLGDECLILGESMRPQPVSNGYGPYMGFDNVDSWPGSVEFEQEFCDPEARMRRFCNDEADAVGLCQWDEIENQDKRCYCGDPNDTPKGGAF
jgi:hypothetical protein